MKIFRKIPAVVEVMQLNKRTEDEALKFCGGKLHKETKSISDDVNVTFYIQNRWGLRRVRLGDYLIKYKNGRVGRVSRCKKNEFKAIHIEG